MKPECVRACVWVGGGGKWGGEKRGGMKQKVRGNKKEAGELRR